MRSAICIILLLLLGGGIVGCRSESVCRDRGTVSAELECREGESLGPKQCPGITAIPPGLNLNDGVSEREAVATALWNNAAFREMLAELGLSQARLYDAGLLTDPQLVTFFPLGPKQFELSAFFAMDVLWLRPIRERAAGLDLASVSKRMVQNGLNLIRDVRLAHANLLFAQRRSQLANEAKGLRKEIADLAGKRLKAGDISELEFNTIEVESLRADADADRFAQDVVIARNALRTLLGLTLQEVSLIAVNGDACPLTSRPVDELLHFALACRPDLRAAEIDVQAACERSNVAKWQFMNLDVVYDANSRGVKGFESGPGLRFTAPIFNGNRGGKAIADAQVQQALQRYVTVRDQITLDVRTAYVQAKQSRDNLDAVQKRILPKLKSMVALATKNYRGGGTSYFLVLQTTSQYLDSRARELELQAAFLRAVAELDRSVGHRISCDTAGSQPLKLVPPNPIAAGDAKPAIGGSRVAANSPANSQPVSPARRDAAAPSPPTLVLPLRPKTATLEGMDASSGVQRAGFPAGDRSSRLRQEKDRGQDVAGESRKASDGK